MGDEDNEYLKAPVEDRVIHKLWKARVSGYEEATKLFNQYDNDDPEWKKFAPSIKKFVTDTNAVAQEKGLDAALAFAENSDLAPKFAGDIVEGCVLKCLGAPKTKTKDLANKIILMLCEIEVHERVVEELIKGLAQKNPKVVAGCLFNIRECLRAFGAKIIKVSPLLKATMPLLDHRDKNIREEGKQLIVESYRWVGDIMKTQLNGLKPVQMTELEAEFEKVSEAGRAKPERYLRSQMAQAATAGSGDTADGGAPGGEGDAAAEEEEALDPYDLMDPVDILSQLPKNFFELVEQKKWQERKQALDALLPLSQTPKIAPGDFNELVRVLKKFVQKDTNVLLVALGAQCLAGVAKGLRNAFKNHAASCLPICLEKFKEKKVNVVNALIEATDALYGILGVEGVQEDCLAALKHKTPTVVGQAAKLLARGFLKCPPQLVTNKKVLKGYVLALLDQLSHQDGTVRDSASEALGVLWKFLGEPQMSKLMPDLDNIKLGKIKEFAEKAELTGKPAAAIQAASAGPKVVKPSDGPKVVKPKTGGVSKPAAKKPAASSAASSSAAPAASKPSSAPAERKVSKPGIRPGAKSAAPSSRKKGEEIDSSPLYSANNLKSSRFKDESKLRVLKWNFSTPRREFVDQLQEQMTTAGFNSTLMSQMYNKDFKQHLKAIESLTKFAASDVDGLKSNLDLILKWLTLRFFETNPSVLLRGLDYLREVFKHLSEADYSLHDLEASAFLPYLLNKSGDPKDQVRNAVRDIVKSLCGLYPAGKVCPYMMDSLKSKNAKQRTEAITVLTHLIVVFGSNVLQPTAGACLKEVAKQIADRDNSVRSAALNCITETYFQDGERMYKMIGNLPEKDMAMLEERIKRQSKTRGPPAAHAPPQQEAPPPAPPAAAAPPSRMAAPSGVQPRPGSNLSRLRPPMGARANVNNNPPEHTGPPPSSMNRGSPAKSRPMSGAFTLDLDKIESAVDRNMADAGIKLVNHNLDDILNDDGVALPPTVTSAAPTAKRYAPLQYRQPQQPAPQHVTPPASNQLTDMPEAYEALDLVLSQILNQDAATCTSALKQMEEVIKDADKVQLLAAGNRMDQLLQACYMQYRHVLQTKMRTDNCNATDVMRLFQYLTMVLMSMYHHADLTRHASASALHDLVHIIVSILLEPAIQDLPQGNQLVRALNVLTVKIVDRSDHTAVTSALLKLLKDGVGNSGLAPKYMELVMKCIWKVIRAMPAWMGEGLNIDAVLSDLHDFLRSYPTSYWKQQSSDTAMRTVKTMLHTMAKTRGDEILDHLTRVNDPENSELVSYLRKLLSSGIGKENQDNSNTNGTANSSIPKKRIVQRMSKDNQEILAIIFKKIGDKEETRQGLQELYNFKQANPTADLEPFLAKSSQYFRDYIENGLKKIEVELGQGGGGNAYNYDENARGGLGSAGGTVSSGTNGSGGKAVLAEASLSSYMDRLRILREKGGLASSGPGAQKQPPAPSGPPAGPASQYRISAAPSYNARQEDDDDVMMGAEQRQPAAKAPAANVEDIRKRLEMIKQSSAIH